MAQEVFGSPINEAAANELFNRYIKIKQRCMPLFKEVLENVGDLEALHYFCGRPDKNFSEENWAFVFDLACLKRMVTKVEAQGASGIFVFHGAKTDGSPTLMMFPTTHFDVQGDEEVEFRILKGAPGDSGGEQHPGTGGGTLAGPEPFNLPDSFTKGQYTAP